MNLDPITQLLLLFAFVPTGKTRAMLEARTKSLVWLLPVSALLAVGGFLRFKSAPPIVTFVLMQTALIFLNYCFFLLFLNWFRQPGNPAKRWIALVSLPLCWTLQLIISIDAPIKLHPDGTAPSWFLGMFNKLYFEQCAPWLESLGLDRTTPMVFAYLEGPLVLLSDYLWPLHYWFGMAVAYLFYELFRTSMNWPAPPRVLTTPIPLTLTAVTLLCGFMQAYEPWLGVCWLFLKPLFVVRGALLVYLALIPFPKLLLAYWGFLFAAMAHSDLFWILGGIGAFESLRGGFSSAVVRQDTLASLHTKLDQMRPVIQRSYRIVPILLYIVAVSVAPIGDIALASEQENPESVEPHTETPDPSVNAVATAVDAGAWIWFDRYEFPNHKKGISRTGVDADLADKECRILGKRLCTSREWRHACPVVQGIPKTPSSDPDADELNVDPKALSEAQANDIFKTARNLLAAAGLSAPTPSKQWPRRITPHGNLDRIGNAFEWVSMPEQEDLWGLAGSSFGDDGTPLVCDFRLIIHAAQFSFMDLSEVGFRCCRDKEKPPYEEN